MRVVIDDERCTGHARCVVVAPSLFVDDERGYGQVIADGTVTDDTLDEARQAVTACPEQAISIVDGPASPSVEPSG